MEREGRASLPTSYDMGRRYKIGSSVTQDPRAEPLPDFSVSWVSAFLDWLSRLERSFLSFVPRTADWYNTEKEACVLVSKIGLLCL